MKNFRLAVLLALTGCVSAGEGVTYRPAPQILPAHIKRLAVRPFVNKTQQFGLEDRLTKRVVDEFLRDGNFPIGQEADSDGIVAGEIARYILTPVSYDTALVPTAYKLTVIVNLKFIDRVTNTQLWDEPNLAVSQLYAPATLPNGLTEQQAQEQLWDVLARDIVARVVRGFGTITGESQRRIAPSTGTASVPVSTDTAPSPTQYQTTPP